MNKPNFFIVGAPKCGTTSLAAWLGEHPEVFMCDPKEPHYFSMDRPDRPPCSAAQYQRFFEGAEESIPVVAEASTSYISSKVAIRKILTYNPDARFAVCLREPAKMAISMHNQRLRTGMEDKRNFLDAWGLQDERARGKALPLLCRSRDYVRYDTLCNVGTQMERMLSVVPREKLFVTVLDDMRNDPKQVYQDILDFLCICDDGRNEFQSLNQSRSLPRVLAVAHVAAGRVKRKLGIRSGTGLLDKIDYTFVKSGESRVCNDVLGMLRSYFRSEVEKLEGLLHRDLSHWKRTGEM